ncbi:MAG: ABC transporter ATP-binding protein [Firmicutes bacterium]|nr:ABC transporter ATP-binding protein [Bacillota bacterium]
MSALITLNKIRKGFQMPDGDTFWALKGIDMEIREGQLTILRGRSGSGKTTLLNILGALDLPTDGSIQYKGEEISTWSDEQRELLRRHQMGFVFQSVALVPMMTAYENVEFALRLAGYEGNHAKRAAECLHMVGLQSRMDHMPEEMSGGEQQRVAIARAICHKPNVIFADEPTAELDTNTGLMVMKIFKELIAEEGITVVVSTHDPGLMELGDTVYEIEAGELIGAEDKTEDEA